jgi:protein-disulfide isomerase
MWRIPLVVAMLFSAYSVVLAFISSYYIKAYCILCIVLYAVNFLLAYFTWLITRRFSHKPFFTRIKDDIEYLKYRKKQAALLLGGFMLAAAALPFVFPAYWNIASVDNAVGIPEGITTEGHPWIGSAAPRLEIVEYSDYQCFQCKKMHFLLRQLVADNPDTIRIVHRNYPMDHRFNPIVKEPFHRGSGEMALLAIYAASKGKFWQMNDYLYQLAGAKKNIRVETVAEALDLDYQELVRALNSRRLRHQLQKDIFSGNKLGISGTPAYAVDGKVHLGQIPAELLKSGILN